LGGEDDDDDGETAGDGESVAEVMASPCVWAVARCSRVTF